MIVREPVARILTPLMRTALDAMCRGAIEHTPSGWASAKGGTWNSHTIGWLAKREYCAIKNGRASITRFGKETLIGVQGWAS